jgi:TonB family protein
MRQVSVAFRLPETAPAPGNGVTGGIIGGVSGGIAGGGRGEPNGGIADTMEKNLAPRAGGANTMTFNGENITVSAPPLPRTTPAENRKQANPMPEKAVIRSITVQGMNVPSEQVTSKLPLRVGDLWTPESSKEFAAAARQTDEHLATGWSYSEDKSQVDIRLMTANSAPAAAALNVPPGTLVVGGRVQAANLISKVDPIYPDLARQARISGTIELAALIGADGHVQQVAVVSGHPLLRQSALDAVTQWVYRTTLLNGQPVPVSTTIDIIFSLSN